MTASTSTDERMARVVRLLADIGSSQDVPDVKIDRMLRQGCELFDVEIGIVSNIVGDDYRVEFVHDRSGAESPGDRFSLPGTFCAITYAADRALGIEDVEDSPHREHPCIETGLRAYIGVPLVLAGGRYGTLNFSSPSPRDTSFEDADLELVELLGSWTESLLYLIGRRPG